MPTTEIYIPRMVTIGGATEEQPNSFSVYADLVRFELPWMLWKLLVLLAVGKDRGRFVTSDELMHPSSLSPRYLYRLKQEIHSIDDLRYWPVVEQRRRATWEIGTYELICDEVQFKKSNLLSLDDADIARAVIRQET